MDTRADSCRGDRSVKVRRDSRKRSKPILANIGPFLPHLRGYGTTRSISGKRNFSVAVRHTQPHAEQSQP